MYKVTRRQALQVSAGLLMTGMARGENMPPKPKGCTLSIGTYAMKMLPVEEAISLIASVGYDGVEIAVRPDWNSAPDDMDSERRKKVRALIADKGLKLTALMEHLLPSKNERQHQKDLERLRKVIALGQDLSPDAVPLVQTIFGKGHWEDSREWLRDRMADWVEVGKAGGAVIAIKPHRGDVLSKPSEAVWLIEQLDNTPWLRMLYDYSHYAFRDMPVAETVRTALPYVAHIAVKDAVQAGGKVVFKLPGASGNFDYADLLRRFYQGGYRGDVCCEVSGMVWNQPGYDPAVAARACYTHMAQAFELAKIPRRS